MNTKPIVMEPEDEIKALRSDLDALRRVLAGCEAALWEAGKDFALSSPLAKRPNLYELHADLARAAMKGGGK